jgi:tetratricopeptide (TPR) repeat protein
MTPDERQQLEHKAERALRRGELRDAVTLLRQLVTACPDDAHARDKLAQLEASLEPGELMSAKAGFRSEASNVYASPQHQAEALAGRGDFAGAITIYQRLISQAPDADLLRERLAELQQLAQATARVPTVSREQLYEHLLERISARRR